MDFGQALAALKARGRVRRPDWNPGLFLECAPSNECLMLRGGGHGLNDTAWYAQHCDLLAEDWTRIDAEDAPARARVAPPAEPTAKPEPEAAPLVVNVSVSTSLMSERDLDKFAARFA